MTLQWKNFQKNIQRVSWLILRNECYIWISKLAN